MGRLWRISVASTRGDFVHRDLGLVCGNMVNSSLEIATAVGISSRCKVVGSLWVLLEVTLAVV
jgi:hypothetical protein